jgi:D-methionine transport system ATP-binding protein
VLLSDEATSALDPETTRSILQLLRDLNRQLGLTVLLITHEMDVVKSICDSAALMEKGRIVESGTVSELLATPGSKLAAALFPVGGEAAGPDRTVVDVTFQGEAATQPVISQLSRTYNIDISILGAAIDTVGGLQVGRMRIELPGRYEDNVVPIGFLREQGLQIDVVGASDAKTALAKEAVK